MRGIRGMLLSYLCFQTVCGVFLNILGDFLEKTEKYSIICHRMFLNTLRNVLYHSRDIKIPKTILKYSEECLSTVPGIFFSGSGNIHKHNVLRYSAEYSQKLWRTFLKVPGNALKY